MSRKNSDVSKGCQPDDTGGKSLIVSESRTLTGALFPEQTLNGTEKNQETYVQTRINTKMALKSSGIGTLAVSPHNQIPQY